MSIMQFKLNIKIGILFTLIILILVGTYFMFKTLKHNKHVFESELQSYIPINATFVVQLNDEINLTNVLSYIHNTDSLIYQIKSNLSYPIYLINTEKASSILAKVTSQQEDILKQYLETNKFPFYNPKIKIYKGAELYFFTTSNNSFYCCTFYNGIFAGSYNSLLIQSIIDSKINNSNFFENNQLKDIAEKSQTLYPANIYINDKGSILQFNTTLKKDSIILTSTNINYKLNREIEDISNLEISNLELNKIPHYPSSFKTLEIDNFSSSIAARFIDWFNLPIYKFNTSKYPDNDVLVIHLKKDKYTLYDYLNLKNIELTNKNIETSYYSSLDLRIYKIEQNLVEQIFNDNGLLYFTFYNDYFIFSKNKQQILDYLQGYNKDSKSYNFDTEATDLIYFTSNDNSIILPLTIYSNKQQILNNKIMNISSYISVKNKKILIQIIANK